MKTKPAPKNRKTASKKPDVASLQSKKDRLERGSVAASRVFRLEKQADGTIRRVAVDPRKHRKKVAAAWDAKTEVARARQILNLTQPAFAEMLGIGVATLRSWEQGKREPSGAAKTLVGIALRHPEVFR